MKTTITITQLTEKEAKWFNVPVGSFKMEHTDPKMPAHNRGVLFPKDLVSGITGRKYNGIIPGQKKVEIFDSSNFGGHVIATTNLDACKKILSKSYKLVIKL